MRASTSLKDFRYSVLNIRKSVHLAAIPATERLIDCGAIQNFDIKRQSIRLRYDLCDATHCENLSIAIKFVFYKRYVSENCQWGSIRSRYLFIFDYTLDYAITFWIRDKLALILAMCNKLSFTVIFLLWKIKNIYILAVSIEFKKHFFQNEIFSLIAYINVRFLLPKFRHKFLWYSWYTKSCNSRLLLHAKLDDWEEKLHKINGLLINLAAAPY